MWIVSTDEFEPCMQTFKDERSARLGYQEFITEREFGGRVYRIYLAEVKEFSGEPAEFRGRDG
jgi:hypothetical protein